jgi:5-methylcytosine-specific restriction endonuclease McrA
MKLCVTCHLFYPFTAFHRNTTRADGVQNRCKSCTAAADKARRASGKRSRSLQNGYNRTYYQNHKEQDHVRSAAWHKAHPEYGRAAYARRVSRLRNVPINDVTVAQRETVITAADGVCVYCAVYKPGCKACHTHSHKLTIDHITAIVNGGDNTLWNLIACCHSCNSAKNKRPNPVPVQPLLL